MCHSPLDVLFSCLQGLEGWLQTDTGEVCLQYSARFLLHAPFVRPSELSVETTLTTDPPENGMEHLKGRRLDSDGRGVLVGTATIPKTGNLLTDILLRLPTEAHAVMAAQFTLPQ